MLLIKFVLRIETNAPLRVDVKTQVTRAASFFRSFANDGNIFYYTVSTLKEKTDHEMFPTYKRKNMLAIARGSERMWHSHFPHCSLKTATRLNLSRFGIFNSSPSFVYHVPTHTVNEKKLPGHLYIVYIFYFHHYTHTHIYICIYMYM